MATVVYTDHSPWSSTWSVEEETNARKVFNGYATRESDKHWASHAMGNGSDGVWAATKFFSNGQLNPSGVFVAQLAHIGTSIPRRFCIRQQHKALSGWAGLKTMMIYTDGACSNNGREGASAGCAFVFNDTPSGTVDFALEKRGRDGTAQTHTSNRAELRAVVAALAFRAWYGEGWSRVVIATDSTYVTDGATDWIRKWVARKWRTASGTLVANRDLWEELHARLGKFADSGCEVSFWHLDRSYLHIADAAAKAAAARGHSPDVHTEIMGIVAPPKSS